MVENIISDVLVIGAGAAAARAAVEAAASGLRVDLVDKGKIGESGTSAPVLSGIATTFNKEEDSPESFFEDWMRSACSISDRNLVWEAITQSQNAVEGLEAIGMEFLGNPDGSRLFYRGAGHKAARGLSAKLFGPKGPNVITVLRAEAERRGVHLHEGIMVTKLLQKDSQVIGAIGISTKGKYSVFNAKAVILAAGGANWLYPNVSASMSDPKYRTTGDAFCLAFAAGAPVVDLEFSQFRESPPGASRFGGRYLNALGERFMEKYAPQVLEKAPRGKVVEAVYREMMAGRGPLVWEVEGIKEAAEAGWTIAQQYGQHRRMELGIDFQRVLGGAQINEKAETPVAGLFAAGESSGGVLGAGRMQGCGFLETQVFGTNAGRNAAVLAQNTERKEIDQAQVKEEEGRMAGIGGNVDPAEVTRTVRKTMWEQVGVIRDGVGLRGALAKFEQLKKETVPRLSGDDIFAALEAKNLLLTAEMATRAALAREETRGIHIRNDYPAPNDENWLKHICITCRRGEIAISTVPVVTTARKERPLDVSHIKNKPRKEVP